MKLRNVAIIAHVDHGKTTLVDAIIKQTGIFRENQEVQERVLDSNDIERERGITILAKNISVSFQDYKINIVDTPGHADFGGEVERILGMVDGALLVVDASEGPMPQTRFVVQKALEKGLSLILVVNKVDRQQARPEEVVDEVWELLISLGATEEQLDFPIYYCSALHGIADEDPSLGQSKHIYPLLEGIISGIPEPVVADGTLQLMVSSLDYDDYIGRIAVGRITAGELNSGQEVLVTHSEKTQRYKGKIANLFTFAGLKRIPAERAIAGDIVAFSGLDNVQIGETLNLPDHPRPLPAISVDEPTLNMVFRVNDGPFAGREGKYLTSRHLGGRLFKEARTNVALRVSEGETPDSFQVAGRGELHLSVLIETMRREGYEFCISKPEPIFREGVGGLEEPYEELVVDIPQEFVGSVMEILGKRKAEVAHMQQLGEDRMRVRFIIPARGLIGFSPLFLTETKGFGIMHHNFSHYGPVKEIPTRENGSLIALEEGEATGYALQNLEQRGKLFVDPGTKVYQGMIVGANSRREDMDVNVAKKKQLTNMRASGSDDAVKLSPPEKITVEKAMGYLSDDEYLEVTPNSLRLRKAILDRHKRKG